MPDGVSDYFPAVTKALGCIAEKDTVGDEWVEGAKGHARCFGRAVSGIILLPVYEIGQIPETLIHLFKIADAIGQLILGLFHNVFVADNTPENRVECLKKAVSILDHFVASLIYPLIPIIQIFKDTIGIVGPVTITMRGGTETLRLSNDPEYCLKGLHTFNHEKLDSWLLKLRLIRKVSIARADHLLQIHHEKYHNLATLKDKQTYEKTLHHLLDREQKFENFNDVSNFILNYSPIQAENPNECAQTLLDTLSSPNFRQAKPQIEQIFNSLTREQNVFVESQVPPLQELAFRRLNASDSFLMALHENIDANHQLLLKVLNQLQCGIYFERDNEKNAQVIRISPRVLNLGSVMIILNLIVRKLDGPFVLHIDNPNVRIDQLPRVPGKIHWLRLAMPVKDQDVDTLGQLYSNQLLSLTLASAKDLTKQSLVFIARYFDLNEIAIHQVGNLTPEEFYLLTEHLHKLNSITFTGFKSTNQFPIANTRGKKKICYEDERGKLFQIGDECIGRFLPTIDIIRQYYQDVTLPPDKERSIELYDSGVGIQFPQDLMAIAPHPNLRKLVLRRDIAGMDVTDACLRAVSTTCPKLQHLALINCFNVASATLVTLVSNCHELESIELGAYLHNAPLRNVPQLVTDDLLNAMALHCPNLKKIKLFSCQNLSKEALVNLIRSCPKIESLSLVGMVVHPEVFNAIRSHLPYLKELDLSYTNAMIGILFQNVNSNERMLIGLKNLRVLNLNYVQLTSAKEIPTSQRFLTFYGVERFESLSDLQLRLNKCRELTTVSLLGNNELLNAKKLAILKASYPDVNFIY